jgi:O-methyltransferase
MDSIFRKRLARLLWPRYSFGFDLVNRNAQMWREIDKYRELGVKEFATREQMYEFLNPQVPVSYLEFGVWHGDSLRMWTQLNRRAESRFYGFDSFEGLPEDWHHSFGVVTDTKRFDVNGQMPSIADDRVGFVKGWFQHTLGNFLSSTELRHPIIVHNDSDLHSSTQYVLSRLDEILRPGDIIIFDEYSSPLNEFLAWEEYKRAFMRGAKCISMSQNWSQAAFVLTGERT